MLLPVSTEFAALCQSQIAMMTEVVGADSTAVYLAESWSTQAVPNLIPIAVYPPPASSDSAARSERRLPPTERFLASPVDADPLATAAAPSPSFTMSDPTPSATGPKTEQRLAVPLVHEGGVLGILVGWRTDRPWHHQERDRLEECARSITLACVLDQRGQWLKNQLAALDQVQDQQSDRFHELLHQLRSPLTALNTFGKLLAKRLPQQDRNQTLVTNMLRESDRMQELLGYFDDTLHAADISREATSTPVPLLAPAEDTAAILEAEALPAQADSLSHFGGILQVQPYAIADLIAPLVDLTAALAEAADMVLHVIAPDQAVWVQADRKALMEILNNFIDNALKYSPPGTHLWLQWGVSRADRPHLTGIVVGDTGPGIPLADQSRIFERHYRGVQAAGELDGSGLGLAIAHDLIHEMSGAIELYSPLSTLPWPLPSAIDTVQPVAGTAFIIWLPQPS